MERDWRVNAAARWDDPPLWHGEQRLKKMNVLASPVHIYRDWYLQPVRFAKFIPPGRYSVTDPQDTQPHYLTEFTGGQTPQGPHAGGPTSSIRA